MTNSVREAVRATASRQKAGRHGVEEGGEGGAFGIAPAGTDAADVAEPSVGAGLAHEEGAGQGSEAAVAGQPAADDDALRHWQSGGTRNLQYPAATVFVVSGVIARFEPWQPAAPAD